LLIQGATSTTGTSWTFSHSGLYWITSSRRLRNTTAPGVVAMFLPTTKGSVSTMRTSPARTSLINCSKPWARLWPPLSTNFCIATGLLQKKLVGATALKIALAQNAARLRSLSVRSGVEYTMSTASRVKVRYTCLIVSQNGSFDHAGSAKRVSSECGGATSSAGMPSVRFHRCNCSATRSPEKRVSSAASSSGWANQAFSTASRDAPTPKGSSARSRSW